MGLIKDTIREKAQDMVSSLVHEQVYKLINFLSNSWDDNQPISLDLQIDVSNITIKYTKITWVGDSTDTMRTSTNYQISRKFVAEGGAGVSKLRRVGIAEIDINFSSTGKLDKINLKEVTCGIGARIHSVKFEFTVKGKISVNHDYNTQTNQALICLPVGSAASILSLVQRI